MSDLGGERSWICVFCDCRFNSFVLCLSFVLCGWVNGRPFGLNVVLGSCFVPFCGGAVDGIFVGLAGVILVGAGLLQKSLGDVVGDESRLPPAAGAKTVNLKQHESEKKQDHLKERKKPQIQMFLYPMYCCPQKREIGRSKRFLGDPPGKKKP